MSVDRGLCSSKRIPLKRLGFLTVCCVIAAPVFVCTIFVLTDDTRTLFFNNEDWLNPRTRIWFAPAATGQYGCAYVGFDDGWPQGGLNTKGVAFDWVAGYMEEWPPDPNMKKVTGNPSERMLGTCATVEDAITFYRQHWEPGFSRAKILVADAAGASAIIGAEGGKLRVERAKQSRGFGYCGQKLQRLLAKSPEPSVPNGAAILRGCLQTGETATKYSNVFNLKTGDIFLFDRPKTGESVKLNLAEELAKGGHYYDIPEIRQQLTKSLMPLLHNMNALP